MYIFLTTMMVLAFIFLSLTGFFFAFAFDADGRKDRWSYILLGLWFLALGYGAWKMALGV